MNSINVATKTPESPVILTDLSATQNTVGSNLSSDDSLFSGVNMTKVISIIIILLFLGYNILQYLADNTNFVNFNISNMFTTFFSNPVKDTVTTSKQGVQDVANLTTETVTSGVDFVEDTVDPERKSAAHEEEYNSALSTLERTARSQQITNEVKSDVTNSSIQNNKLDKGYCYVGTDRDYRTCVKVNARDECMSGDIFPSRAICVNPSLRE